ncbi:MAG TPA: PASTA domain-containing protein, partial [Pilimelia sp.]|nr:PASTA domain-containing protein [Pilimelia sp.]
VTLTVSKGRPAVSVPQVVGGSLAQARGLLERLGLVVTTELVTSDTPAGQVLGQSVAAGAGLDTRARITLRVSKGPAEVVLPRVLDQPCGRAQEALEELGLRVRVTYFPTGTVRVQQPAEGTSVPPRSIVTIGCM